MKARFWNMTLAMLILATAGVASGTTFEEAIAVAGDGKYVKVNGPATDPTFWAVTVDLPTQFSPAEGGKAILHLMTDPLSTNFQVDPHNGTNIAGYSVTQFSYSGRLEVIVDQVSAQPVTRLRIRQLPQYGAGALYLDAVEVVAGGGESIFGGTLYGWGTWSFGEIAVLCETPASIQVQIDIKPGTDPNPINQGANGVIPVAILTTPDFDATRVDPATVVLNGATVAVRGKSEKLLARMEDVDGDADADLLCQVDTECWAEILEDGYVTLTGSTSDGIEIVGQDWVVVVPPSQP